MHYFCPIYIYVGRFEHGELTEVYRCVHLSLPYKFKAKYYTTWEIGFDTLQEKIDKDYEGSYLQHRIITEKTVNDWLIIYE